MDTEKKYTITELSEFLGIAESTIRKYEKDYNIKIPRNKLGHRYYTEPEIKLYKQILAMKKRGANIHQIRELLSKSVDADNQKKVSIEKVKVDTLTVKELKETMGDYIAEMIIQKEEELAQRYESKLEETKEEIRKSIREDIKSENQKLMNYIEEKRKKKKKSLFKFFK